MLTDPVPLSAEVMEAVVEAVARGIARHLGRDPDARLYGDGAPTWTIYAAEARTFAKAALAVLAEHGLLDQGWQPIESAPKDGSKVDLLFPYPRGRQIDCFWMAGDIAGPEGGWYWRRPSWGDGGLLPEDEWTISCYPNMQPTHWRSPPAPPLPASTPGRTG